MSESEVPLQLSVVMPAYQEADAIAKTLDRARTELDALGMTYEIVLVCDGCTDDTATIARAQGIEHLSVIDYQPNRGKGHALRTGFGYTNGNLVAFLDADLDIHPSGIPRLLRELERTDADAVVASKVHPDSEVVYPTFRRVQSRVFRRLIRVLFSLDVADSQTGLKVFRRELLATCLPLVQSTGFAFDLELLVLANDAGFRVIEGPVQLDYQFSTTTGWRAVREMVRDLGSIVRRRRAGRRAGTWTTKGANS
jgi:glycosyltransferase involved in cell wall biosynthesis